MEGAGVFASAAVSLLVVEPAVMVLGSVTGIAAAGSGVFLAVFSFLSTFSGAFPASGEPAAGFFFAGRFRLVAGVEPSAVPEADGLGSSAFMRDVIDAFDGEPVFVVLVVELVPLLVGELSAELAAEVSPNVNCVWNFFMCSLMKPLLGAGTSTGSAVAGVVCFAAGGDGVGFAGSSPGNTRVWNCDRYSVSLGLSSLSSNDRMLRLRLMADAVGWLSISRMGSRA